MPDNCEWCKFGNEACGTCKRYFGADYSRCSAEPEEVRCIAYEPFGYCPNCGRKLGNDDGEE